MIQLKPTHKILAHIESVFISQENYSEYHLDQSKKAVDEAYLLGVNDTRRNVADECYDYLNSIEDIKDVDLILEEIKRKYL